MLSNKIIAVLAASSAVAVFSAAAANADPIVKQEQNQLGDSECARAVHEGRPVDPGRGEEAARQLSLAASLSAFAP